MSSSESNLNSTPAPLGPGGTRRSSAGMVALSLILLAGLVWAMAPGRAKFVPAPLRPVLPGCPLKAPDFVPSDSTEVPGVDLSALSAAQKNRVLFRVNMEPCPCGCNNSLAACRTNHPTCPVGKELVEKIMADETGANGKVSGDRSQ
jgi:hypothetical protein